MQGTQPQNTLAATDQLLCELAKKCQERQNQTKNHIECAHTMDTKLLHLACVREQKHAAMSFGVSLLSQSTKCKFSRKVVAQTVLSFMSQEKRHMQEPDDEDTRDKTV